MSFAKCIVIKLGGTSQCKHGYDELIKTITAPQNEYKRFVIVLSAISGVTDLLEKYTNTKDIEYLAAAFTSENDLRTKLCIPYVKWENYCDSRSFLDADDDDKLYQQSRMIGSGEIRSSNVLYDYLKQNQIFGNEEVMLFSSYDFIKSKKETFKLYPSSQFYGDYELFQDCLYGEEGLRTPRIVICQGFIASTPSGKTILLGRGGSDTTGALIANMLDASEYQVWTDVSGIFSCDPRIIPDAKRIMDLDYSLAVEIAEMGAKVMHPFSILPCAMKNIPIRVKNTFDMKAGETIIDKVTYETPPVIIAVQKKVTLIKISSQNMWNSYGFMHDIFRRFTENKIDVNIVTTSPSSVYTTTDETDKFILRSVTCDLSNEYNVECLYNCAIVSIVSSNIKVHLGKITFDDYPSHIIHFGANGMSLNFVVGQQYVNDMIISFYDKLVK